MYFLIAKFETPKPNTSFSRNKVFREGKIVSKLSFLSDLCIINDLPSTDGYESIQKNVSM